MAFGRRLLGLILAVLLLTVSTDRAVAQEIQLTGRGDVALDRRLERLLRSGDFTLITRDTLIGGTDTIPHALLVLNARLMIEGVVDDDVVGVESELFIRPAARVRGDLVNIGGGLYRSEVAVVEGTVIDAALAPYHVVDDEDSVQIVASSRYVALQLHGLLGFEIPTYDRVDAVGLGWAAIYRPQPLGGVHPSLHGRISYRSGRGAWQGRAEFSLTRSTTGLAVGVEEATQTNEWWIRGAPLNSIGYFALGSDVRDYFEARRGYIRFDQRFTRGRAAVVTQLRAQIERSQSLEAGHPWTVLSGSHRPNPSIDDGTISSLLLSTFGGWNGRSAQLEGGGSLEIGGRKAGGEFSFARFLAWGEWAMLAFRNHTLGIEWQMRGPLPGTQSLPGQRWSFVGGSSTLPTFETGEFRGDRVVFVESRYVIPLPESWGLPVLGAPDVEAFHATGMAWTADESRRLEQNIGVRFVFLSPYLRITTDPRDPIRALELGIGITSPFSRHYPWARDLP